MILKTCKWYQTARLVKTRHLICNMPITPAHYWMKPDFVIKSSFELTYEDHHVLVSNCLDERYTMVPIPRLCLS